MERTHLLVTLALAPCLFPTLGAAQDTLSQAIARKQVRVLGKQLRGDPSGVYCVQYSPDGKRVLTGGYTGELRLFSASTTKLAKKIPAHKGTVQLARFYDEGKKIVSLGNDRCIAFFDAKTGFELGRIRDLPKKFADNSYGSFAMTADGKQLLVKDPTRGAKALVCVDLEKRALAEPFPLPGDPISRFALSPDDRYLALIERDRRYRDFLHLYDRQEKKTVVRVAVRYPNAMHFSPDGSKLFVLDYKFWWTWDGRTGKKLGSVKSIVDTPRGVASTPDGSILYIGAAISGHVVGFDMKGSKERFRYPHFATQVLGVALSPDGKTIAAGSTGGSLRFLYAKTGKEKKAPKPLGTRVTAVALAPDGMQMVTGTLDQEVSVWDLKRKRVARRSRDHKKTIRQVGFNAKGQPWSIDSDKVLMVHDAKKRKVIKTVDLKSGGDNLMDAIPTPDGKLLLASHWVKTAKSATGKQVLWNLETGTIQQTIETEKIYNALSISPDGKTVAAVQNDRLALWPFGGKEPIFAFEPQKSGYYGVVLVGTEAAATLDSDDRVQLWKKGNPKVHKMVPHKAGLVMDFSATPDGKYIFVGGLDAIVIFDSELNEVGRTTAFDGIPVTLTISPDGKSLISGMSDSTVLFWAIDKLVK